MSEAEQKNSRKRESASSDRITADAEKKKTISMAMKVDSSVAGEFRKMAKESGMEQGVFLQAMLDNYRLNEDKSLYKEFADDIQLMRDLTATINYKYVALIAQNKVAEEKAHARDAGKIDQLEQENRKLLEEKKVWGAAQERCSELEHEVKELKEMLFALQNRLDQTTAAHKNEIDALTNKHNAALTDMARSYAEQYLKFAEQAGMTKTAESTDTEQKG